MMNEDKESYQQQPWTYIDKLTKHMPKRFMKLYIRLDKW